MNISITGILLTIFPCVPSGADGIPGRHGKDGVHGNHGRNGENGKDGKILFAIIIQNVDEIAFTNN